MGKLGEIAKARSPFLKVLPGEEVTVCYKGFKMVPDTFNPEGQDKFRFILEIDRQTKYWDTGSNAVAMFFDFCEDGEMVVIKNVGDEKKSKWELKKFSELGQEEPKKK